MNISKVMLILATSIVLTSCAVNKKQIDYGNPEIVSKAVSIKNDEYTKNKMWFGPIFSPDGLDDIYLAGLKEKDGKSINYYLFINDFYTREWRFYDQAYDSDGNKMIFIPKDRKVVDCRSSCSFRESFSIILSREYLENHRNTGIHIKVFGKRGSEVFDLPAGYVDGFLMAIR